jgi:hypothetical protein
MPKTFCTALTSILIALTFAACADSPPAWQLECESLSPGYDRGDACKEACGADELCPGAAQPACETECNACTPDVAWCPVVSE